MGADSGSHGGSHGSSAASEVDRRDLQLISKLVDGRLEGKEREAALERIEGDEALYEIFVETARYRESQQSKGLLFGFPRGRAAVTGGLLAAALAVVAVVPKLVGGSSMATSALASALLANGDLEGRLQTADWLDPPWPVMRGGSSSLSVGDQKLLFRVGVRVVDLEMAIGSGLREDAGHFAHEAAMYLGSLDLLFLDPEYQQGYRDVARKIGAENPEREITDLTKRLSDGLSALELEGPPLDLGRWSRAGLWAVRSGNRELLESRDFKRLGKRLAGSEWWPAAEVELELLDALLAAGLNEPGVSKLEATFQRLVEST